MAINSGVLSFSIIRIGLDFQKFHKTRTFFLHDYLSIGWLGSLGFTIMNLWAIADKIWRKHGQK
jgi:hypothetical protein